MNKTKIEWCDMTWNPVTGCLNDCEYCYARKQVKRFEGWDYSSGCVRVNIHEDKTYIACDTDTHRNWDCESFALEGGGKIADLKSAYLTERYNAAPYPFGFIPTFHRYRLSEPAKVKKPQNIFVCSMADLFGDWVPDEWIQAVFDACNTAPQHRYLFLTKNPKRYESFDQYMPPNMFFGWTQTGPSNPLLRFFTHHSWHTFISIEPLLQGFDEFHIKGLEWVIIGAETGTRKDKIIPKREWIASIVSQCRAATKIPIFMKPSLAPIWGEPLIQEYPWKENK